MDLTVNKADLEKFLKDVHRANVHVEQGNELIYRAIQYDDKLERFRLSFGNYHHTCNGAGIVNSDSFYVQADEEFWKMIKDLKEARSVDAYLGTTVYRVVEKCAWKGGIGYENGKGNQTAHPGEQGARGAADRPGTSDEIDAVKNPCTQDLVLLRPPERWFYMEPFAPGVIITFSGPISLSPSNNL